MARLNKSVYAAAMIRVCVVHGKKSIECHSFPNERLSGAINYARIGSQSGAPRAVSLCGKRVRVYKHGKKVAGSVSMAGLRRLARSCRTLR